MKLSEQLGLWLLRKRVERIEEAIDAHGLEATKAYHAEYARECECRADGAGEALDILEGKQ